MSREFRENAWLDRLALRAIESPLACLLGWALVLGLAMVGLLRLDIDTSTASFLNRTGPQWLAYQASLQDFGGDEILVVAIEGDRPFDRAVLQDLVRLTPSFAAIPGVRRVDSLATVPLIRATPEGDVNLGAALARGVPEGEEFLQLIEAIRADRIAPGGLISKDERVFAVNLLLDEDVDADRAATVAAVREILGNRRAWVSGVPVFRTAVNSRTRGELLLFVPLTLVLIGCVLMVAFRSLPGVVIPLVVGATGVVVAVGTMGALGVTLSLSTLILPSVLLALGCAYAMHVVTAAQGVSGRAEVWTAIRPVLQPVALSGLTTAIGFLAMSTVGIAAIRELATYGALGVVVTTAASLTLAPAILSRWPVRSIGSAIDGFTRNSLRKALVSLVARRRRLIVVLWALLLVVFAVGLMRLQVSTDIIVWFPHGTQIRDDYDLIRDRLSGITPVNIVVSAEAGGSVADPAVVRAVGQLGQELEALPQVGKALSLADPLRQVKRVFGDGADELPATRPEVEQYLLILSAADYLNDVVSWDRSKANVLLRVDDNSSDEIVGLSEWVDRWWQRNGVAGFQATTTGIMYEFARAEEEIAYGQIRGLALALGAIAVILLLLLRAPGQAGLALLPNVIPIGIAFGFMGLAGVALDAATVCLGSLALGIAVDDTIHVVTAFRQAVQRGEKPLPALDSAFHQVLPPLCLTTAAICVGFAVLGTSGFTLIRNLGAMTCALVLLCLLADTTLLPALLLRSERTKAP